ncbi:MAG: hypothetical protein KA319_09710 [Ferruginibacter sp.]|nr:hypothetical protein [Ferruginibacter sp.]
MSCNDRKAPRLIERNFYYWKSNLNLSSLEKKTLKELNVKTLYIKFFDIDWNAQQQKALPIAKLTTNENSLADVRESKYIKTLKFTVTPTIFITNETFINIDTSAIIKLTSDVYNLVSNTLSQYAFDNMKGIQFDCDWTESTRDKYFLFLSTFKKIWGNGGMEISATIRLHQIKFLSKTGIPPVDRGLLMCYNMGNLKNPATTNSIIETAELKKYIANLSTYPLSLDVALPLFEWNVLFRKNMYNGILRDFDIDKLPSSITIKKDNKFTLLKDTIFDGYELFKDDMIRNEKSDFSTIIDVVNAINPKLINTQLRVSLYHLDSVILTKYKTHELETIYNSLR